jgi:hypothetical protein
MAEPMESQVVGPDGQPAVFDGAAWVSQDRRYWWNGANWQPIKKPGFRPSGLVIILGLFVVGAVAFIVYGNLTRPFEGEGVTNAKIDSTTQIEFDYHASRSCNNLTFDYKFFDSGGHQVDSLSDANPHAVSGGSDYHFTISGGSGVVGGSVAIDSRAARFEADAICSA